MTPKDFEVIGGALLLGASAIVMLLLIARYWETETEE